MVDALRRIAGEEIEAALAATREGDTRDLGVRIHEIRKHMKKLRGLIRLVRPSFPDYRTEDACFRDIARSVANARDAEVTSTTLDQLLDTHGKALAPEAFAGLRAEVAAGRRQDPDLAPVAEALGLARGRVDLWTLHETGWDAVAGGLRRTYRRARKRRRANGDEELHAWRKPIKYHWYHVRLLREIAPEEMDRRGEAAEAMGGQLGLLQDLAVLDRRVKRSALPKESRRVLRGLIGQRMDELEDEARALAPQLIDEKPGALADRWRGLWEAWRG